MRSTFFEATQCVIRYIACSKNMTKNGEQEFQTENESLDFNFAAKIFNSTTSNAHLNQFNEINFDEREKKKVKRNNDCEMFIQFS